MRFSNRQSECPFKLVHKNIFIVHNNHNNMHFGAKFNSTIAEKARHLTVVLSIPMNLLNTTSGCRIRLLYLGLEASPVKRGHQP